MRINHADGVATVEFLFCGRAVTARAGESVAAALFASGEKTLRRSPRRGSPRGMFCLMGSCQECLVLIDERRVLACRLIARNGMRVEMIPEAGIVL